MKFPNARRVLLAGLCTLGLGFRLSAAAASLPGTGVKVQPGQDNIDGENFQTILAIKALEALGLMSVGDLTQIAEARLLACKNFGQTSLAEIKKKLSDLGLSLRS